MEKVIEQTARLFLISALRYFVIAGVFFAVFYWLFKGRFGRNKIQPKEASRKDFAREILHSMSSMLVMTVIAVLILFTPFRQYTLVYGALTASDAWYLPLSVALSLVIHDTYFYWMHRALHHPALFRATHLLHHKSTNPSPWASYSFHFFEAITEGAVLVLLVMVMPMHPAAIGLFVVLGLVINVYGHLGYEITPRWLRHTFLFGIVNTSVYHNLHHRKFKGNYGLYFRVWDRLMGTEHPDYVAEYDRLQERRFGAAKTPGTSGKAAIKTVTVSDGI